MPLQSRLNRKPAPVGGDNLAPSLGTTVDENTSPRRRTMTPAQAGAAAAPEPRQDDLDQQEAAAAAPDLDDAVAAAGAAYDQGSSQVDEQTPAPAAVTPAPKRRGPKPKPPLPEGAETSDDPIVLNALLHNIAGDVKAARKEYEAKVKPLVEQYKAISAKIADLLPGRI